VGRAIWIHNGFKVWPPPGSHTFTNLQANDMWQNMHQKITQEASMGTQNHGDDALQGINNFFQDKFLAEVLSP